ncbi:MULTISPECIES: DUF4232 domain-containing protein [unclassified Nonomuraea]|uniref:DUF4232 domain-containing protein n=1 Tax=unclassified Nonomuraea TaxID=2593643 RepID=UPI0033F2274C
MRRYRFGLVAMPVAVAYVALVAGLGVFALVTGEVSLLWFAVVRWWGPAPAASWWMVPMLVLVGAVQGCRAAGPKHRVTVRPGGSARATLHWTVVETGDETACPSPTRLLVIPPDERSYLNVPFDAGRVCDGGRLDVTPLA